MKPSLIIAAIDPNTGLKTGQTATHATGRAVCLAVCLALCLALGLAPVSNALAQHTGHGHHGHSQPASPATDPGTRAQAPSAAAQESEWVDGEVRRLDREQGRVTLRHGDIRSLDMPPMTMVFQVSDTKMIDSLAPGDTVRFRVVAEGTRYRITALEKR
jgi:Cu/Ag efflux protein CusF